MDRFHCSRFDRIAMDCRSSRVRAERPHDHVRAEPPPRTGHEHRSMEHTAGHGGCKRLQMTRDIACHALHGDMPKQNVPGESKHARHTRRAVLY
mmetsp:Transcript_36539/g.107010  ORF Transcript_36539/g.107010 Transcript_36539/m.107010 type:complete len:94 (+) Transcript_36539:62-343(+)